MSRTKRYVPHHVIRDALHPMIDPQTGQEYVWASPERTQYYAQRDASRLRGDDGKNRKYHSCWGNPMDAVRTDYRRLIAEGIEDHFDALEDHGKTFDWCGNDQNEVYDEDQYQQYLDDLAREEEYARREEEYERELLFQREDSFYSDYDDDFYF